MLDQFCTTEDDCKQFSLAARRLRSWTSWRTHICKVNVLLLSSRRCLKRDPQTPITLFNNSWWLEDAWGVSDREHILLLELYQRLCKDKGLRSASFCLLLSTHPTGYGTIAACFWGATIVWNFNKIIFTVESWVSHFFWKNRTKCEAWKSVGIP